MSKTALENKYARVLGTPVSGLSYKAIQSRIRSPGDLVAYNEMFGSYAGATTMGTMIGADSPAKLADAVDPQTDLGVFLEALGAYEKATKTTMSSSHLVKTIVTLLDNTPRRTDPTEYQDGWRNNYEYKTVVDMLLVCRRLGHLYKDVREGTEESVSALSRRIGAAVMARENDAIFIALPNGTLIGSLVARIVAIGPRSELYVDFASDTCASLALLVTQGSPGGALNRIQTH